MSHHRAKAALKIVLVSFVVVLLAALGLGALVVHDVAVSYRQRAVVLEAPALPSPTASASATPAYTAMAGSIDVLLVGTDICEKSYAKELGGRCTDAQANYTSANNDVTVLLHISDSPRRVTVISFPRDLVIPTPTCRRPDGSTAPATTASMLNATYSYGGLSCVAKTISTLTGIGIPYAASITFGGVIALTDAIGGVSVCVANGIDDPYTHLHLSPGMHTVKGLTALQFLRTRHGLFTGSDLARISNQQQYMTRLVRKLTDAGVLDDPVTLSRLASVALQNITPSTTLTDPATLVRIALAVKSVPLDQIVMVQYPTADDPRDEDRVLPNTDAADALLAALKRNEQLKITAKDSPGYGVVQQTPAPTASPAPAESAAPPAAASASPGSSVSATGSAGASTSPRPSATPGDVAVLPSGIAGTTAAESTCANGNGR